MTNPERKPWMERSSGLASVSVFLSDSQGRLLMVQDLEKYGGKWSPIAGYIDDLVGEEPEVAALRETKEEMNLEVRLDQLLGVWHYYENGNKPKMHVGYAYTGTILSGTFTPQAEEIQHWGFFSPAEIERMFTEGKIKTPQYNYQGFRLWENGTKHPLTVVQSNRSITFTE